MFEREDLIKGLDNIKMKNLVMVYHEATNSHWVNDLNWKERHKNESISYGHVEIDAKDISEVNTIMSRDGYYLVPNDGIPWSNLGKIKPEMLSEKMPMNIFNFE